jgi:hypothetical protein
MERYDETTCGKRIASAYDELYSAPEEAMRLVEILEIN